VGPVVRHPRRRQALRAGRGIANALIQIDPRYPAVGKDQKADLLVAKQALEAEAPKGAAPDPIAAELEAKTAVEDDNGGKGRKVKGKKKG
jgi:hypothetical protein